MSRLSGENRNSTYRLFETFRSLTDGYLRPFGVSPKTTSIENLVGKGETFLEKPNCWAHFPPCHQMFSFAVRRGKNRKKKLWANRKQVEPLFLVPTVSRQVKGILGKFCWSNALIVLGLTPKTQHKNLKILKRFLLLYSSFQQYHF